MRVQVANLFREDLVLLLRKFVAAQPGFEERIMQETYKLCCKKVVQMASDRDLNFTWARFKCPLECSKGSLAKSLYICALRATMYRAMRTALPMYSCALDTYEHGRSQPYGAGTSGFGDNHGLRSEACNSEVMRVLEDISVGVLCGMAAVVGKESHVP